MCPVVITVIEVIIFVWGEKMDRFCGGTFFVLLSSSRRPMQSNAESYKGNSNNQAEFDLMCALSKVVNPSYQVLRDRTAQNNIGNFKKCVNWGASSFAFQDYASRKDFQKRFESGDIDIKIRMNDLVESFLDEKKDTVLVKAIIETIVQDDEILPDHIFYIGKSVTKDELVTLEEVSLVDFLLGVWYYVYIEVKDNTIGADTYERWCPPKNRGYRDYEGTIGEDSTLKIDVKRSHTDESHVPKIQTVNIPVPIAEDAAEIKKDNPLSENDELLLQEFRNDYDDLIQKCIDENHEWGWLDGTISQKITFLHENKWKVKLIEFQDFALQTNIMNILNSLKKLGETMNSDSSLFISPNSIRRDLMKQYVMLQSSDSVGVLPYGAFIDDWND